jgi:CRISPR-associated protein Csb2
MFALEVEYLTGRAVACLPDDRDTAEWPPHPGRLFMALVAAHVERDPSDSAERAALLWLESLSPPEISASPASRRDVLEVFVPVNDNFGPDRVPKEGFSSSVVSDKVRVLPERRTKQARTFPSVTPWSPHVFYIWPEVASDQAAVHRPALERLAASATYLGHSSSLVRLALCDNPPDATHVPSDEGNNIFRVATPGRLADLMACHDAQRRPSMGFFCSYAHVESSTVVPKSSFGSMVAFELSRADLSLAVTAKLMAAVRDAVMKLSEIQPAPEVISGHSPDSAPSQRDHVAFVPLAFVDHRFADGMIRGFAAVIPNDVKGEQRTIVLRGLGRLKKLWLGSMGEWTVERIIDQGRVTSLNAWPYTRVSQTWATVTPVVFDRFPRKGAGRDESSIVARSCRRIGLPNPVSVEVSHVSRFRGVPTSAEFNVRHKAGAPARPYAHVSLLFDTPVKGPVILGAGRYQGLGLFRSMDSHQASPERS